MNSPSNGPATAILALLRRVQSRLDQDLSLGALASAARRSPFELHRAFRRVVGETAKQYTLRLRLDRAAAELLAGRRTILDLALASGFESHEVFTRAFRRRFGMSPRDYRGRGLAVGDRPDGGHPLAARHAEVVRRTAPCIGLHHLRTQDSGRNHMTVSVTVSRRELASQAALVIRRRIQASEIAATLGEILPRVFTHAQRAGIPLAGPPFARYLSVGRGLMTIEAGMAIAVPAAGEGEIEAIELPGGPAAFAVHAGPYDSLSETHAAIEAWIESGGHRSRGAPWEVYVTDPADHPDPADWRTEVFWPLERQA
jgi:AraC family transcriptional regulator